MMPSLLEGTLVMLLALVASRLCADPERRTSLWFAALLLQPLIVLTAASGLEWRPWNVAAPAAAALAVEVSPTASIGGPLTLAAFIYSAGILWRVWPWCRSIVWAHRIVATGAAPRPPHWQQLNASLASNTRQRVPVLRVHSQVDAPFLTGALRPAICLPTALEFCDPAQARHVLLHEHAHWRANDWWRAQCVELVACLLWFHPLVHLMRAHFRRDLELACDARVLQTGADARDYARTLLQLSHPDAGSRAMALGMTTQRSQLVERVACILNRRRATGFARRWPVVMLGVAGLAACAINPLPRFVYEQIQPPPLVVNAAATKFVDVPVSDSPASPGSDAIARVPPVPSRGRAENAITSAALHPESRRAPLQAGASASTSATTDGTAMTRSEGPIPASSARLYRSLAQVARDEVPWPGVARVMPTRLDAPYDPRFEDGMRKGRLERDRRIERNVNRAFMITGRVPLAPSVKIQPGSVRVGFGDAGEGGGP